MTESDMPWPRAQGVFSLGDLPLAAGGVLPDARLSWSAHGTLSPARDNVILFPTSFGAQHPDLAWAIGAERLFDPAQWFVVIADMFGNGLSSSPSNTPLYPPLVTVGDNVRAQARLLAQQFGVAQLAAVYGFSMGALQAYHWAAMAPLPVKRAIIVCGTARTAPHNRVFIAALRAILEAAPEYRAPGRFITEPAAARRAFTRCYAGWAMSQAWYRAGLHLSSTGATSLEDFLDAHWQPGFTRSTADYYAQLRTWETADIAAEGFAGDLGQALAAIHARVLLLPCETDLYFPPADNAAELPALTAGQLRIIPSIWGHIAGAPDDLPAEHAFLRAAVRSWLADESPVSAPG